MTDAPRANSAGNLSAAPPRSIELGECAVPTAVAKARHRVRDFALAHGADPSVAEGVALAVSEAVTNAVRYAYEPGSVGNVGVRAAVANGFLEVKVTDQGLGFRDHGGRGLGLGLSIIADLCAELEISQDRKGTELRMRFLLDSPKS